MKRFIRCLCGVCAVYVWLLPGCAPSLSPAQKVRESTRRPDAQVRRQDSADADTVSVTAGANRRSDSVEPSATDSIPPGAAGLVIRACNNYLRVNDSSAKHAEVLMIKASTFFNQGYYSQARRAARRVVTRHFRSDEYVPAIRTVAQSYYKEKDFARSQQWYARLKEEAPDTEEKQIAQNRMSESMFRMAEQYEENQQYEEAARTYEEAALSHPQSAIADVALFNAGQAYERIIEWDHATLMYQKLMEKYPRSDLIPKALFRTARCHEKNEKWRRAARMYLKVVTEYPEVSFSQTALYNAGFAFENAGELTEAAATFEKMARLFPDAKTAPDLLFRAAELYGKLEDWDKVSDVTAFFTEKYGDRRQRIVQALCMRGVALYMKDRNSEARQQLNRAIDAYRDMEAPGDANAYYAAKAQYTLGEMVHTRMNDIALPYSTHPRYSATIQTARRLREEAITQYSRVIEYQITEWVTRGLFQIGKTHEDFGLLVMNQQRDKSLSAEESFSVELAIAEAVEAYFIDKALTYHERNVNLGIDNEVSNRFITRSREKCTQLPFLVGDNYLSIIGAYRKVKAAGYASLRGFSLVSQKLSMLQTIAPYKSRAIDAFIRTLEMASLYRQQDTYYDKARMRVTEAGYSLGKTYMGIASVARGAPIPAQFDPYETFRYKIKLLGRIEEYVENSVANFNKVLQIAGSYDIEDTCVEHSRNKLAEVLWYQARSYDVLAENVFAAPPFPTGITEQERVQYRAQFEEVGVRLSEKAMGLYARVYDNAKKGYAAGEYVRHAYVRLFQEHPQEYGVERMKDDTLRITSSPKWRCTVDPPSCWQQLTCDTGSWQRVHRATVNDSLPVQGFGNDPPTPMWYGTETPASGTYEPASEVFFRREFTLPTQPREAICLIAGIDDITVYCNGESLHIDSTEALQWQRAKRFDLTGKIRTGTNVCAVRVHNTLQLDYGLWVYAHFIVQTGEFVAQPPGRDAPLDSREVGKGRYTFPPVENFTLKTESAVSATPQKRRSMQ